jgi:hypothetical protein
LGLAFLPACGTHFSTIQTVGATTPAGTSVGWLACRAMTHERQVFIYRFDTGEGERDVVSILEPGLVFEHGLHPETIMGMLRGGANLEQLSPDDLQENPSFLRLLSRVLYEHLDQDEQLQREAEIQGEGHIYLLDARTPDPGGRVPPQDIIGTVAVTGGQITIGSYQHNRRHRLLTGDGWFRLPYQLEIVLQQRIRARHLSQ